MYFTFFFSLLQLFIQRLQTYLTHNDYFHVPYIGQSADFLQRNKSAKRETVATSRSRIFNVMNTAFGGRYKTFLIFSGSHVSITYYTHSLKPLKHFLIISSFF